jgi:broad specificity phosphatase PhoE
MILVRHAMPEVRSYVPPDLWELGAEGRAAARALAVRLPGDCYLVASDEPKAVQTLRELGPGVAVDAGFREVARPRVWTDDHRALARTYLSGVRHDGWETHAQVSARFADAVARHERLAAGRRLLVGTHGMALTVYLAGRVPLDPVAFWSGLAFPDIVDLGRSGRFDPAAELLGDF